jgi:hypothetical protein
MTAMAQAANAIETIERIISSRLKSSLVVKAVDSAATVYWSQNAGPAPFLP